MTKESFQVCSAELLADLAIDQLDSASFPEVLDENANMLEDVKGMWFVLWWPQHSSKQHLSDATIHGPFGTREDAEAYR